MLNNGLDAHSSPVVWGWKALCLLRKEELVVVSRALAVSWECEEGPGVSPSAHGVPDDELGTGTLFDEVLSE